MIPFPDTEAVKAYQDMSCAVKKETFLMLTLDQPLNVWRKTTAEFISIKRHKAPPSTAMPLNDNGHSIIRSSSKRKVFYSSRVVVVPQRIHDSIHARIVPQDAGRKGTPQGVEAHARPVRHFPEAQL